MSSRSESHLWNLATLQRSEELRTYNLVQNLTISKPGFEQVSSIMHLLAERLVCWGQLFAFFEIGSQNPCGNSFFVFTSIVYDRNVVVLKNTCLWLLSSHEKGVGVFQLFVRVHYLKSSRNPESQLRKSPNNNFYLRCHSLSYQTLPKEALVRAR
jgi:hypothetical protein